MCLTEFNEKVYTDAIRAEGELFMLFKLVKRKRMTVEEAAAEYNIGTEEFRKRMQECEGMD